MSIQYIGRNLYYTKPWKSGVYFNGNPIYGSIEEFI